MEIKPGFIYWLKTESKFSHPYVVIKINEDQSLLVCGITTNMKKINYHGLKSDGSFLVKVKTLF